MKASALRRILGHAEAVVSCSQQPWPWSSTRHWCCCLCQQQQQPGAFNRRACECSSCQLIYTDIGQSEHLGAVSAGSCTTSTGNCDIPFLEHIVAISPSGAIHIESPNTLPPAAPDITVFSFSSADFQDDGVACTVVGTNVVVPPILTLREATLLVQIPTYGGTTDGLQYYVDIQCVKRVSPTDCDQWQPLRATVQLRERLRTGLASGQSLPQHTQR